MLALILSTQLLPVQGGLGRRRGGLSQRGLGIDVEIAVVRMLLAEVVARLRLGLTSGEDLLQLLDKFLQILAGKFPAEPKYQSWYLAHGGDSLRNLVGSWKVGLQRESPPPFLLGVKSDREPSTLRPAWGKPPCLPKSTPAHRGRRGRKQKWQHPPPIQQIIGLQKGSF